MYRYEFTSTHEDLLEAEDAERSTFLRKPFRWAVVLLGLAWLAAGIVTLLRQPTIQPLMWVCLGGAVLYYFGIRPHRRRSRITKTNVTRQSLTLEFADHGVKLGISGVGQFMRHWNELAGIMDAKKGVLFYFTDGVKNWLPNRVFGSEEERKNFLEFVKGHQADLNLEPGDANQTKL